MNNLSNTSPESFNSEASNYNLLWQYVQSMNQETIDQLSKPSSPEVLQAIERTIGSMLGNLPSENFNVMMTTSRENLGQLIFAAMMNGYFLRNAEQRMTFEKSLQMTEAI